MYSVMETGDLKYTLDEIIKYMLDGYARGRLTVDITVRSMDAYKSVMKRTQGWKKRSIRGVWFNANGKV